MEKDEKGFVSTVNQKPHPFFSSSILFILSDFLSPALNAELLVIGGLQSPLSSLLTRLEDILL